MVAQENDAAEGLKSLLVVVYFIFLTSIGMVIRDNIQFGILPVSLFVIASILHFLCAYGIREVIKDKNQELEDLEREVKKMKIDQQQSESKNSPSDESSEKRTLRIT